MFNFVPSTQPSFPPGGGQLYRLQANNEPLPMQVDGCSAFQLPQPQGQTYSLVPVETPAVNPVNPFLCATPLGGQLPLNMYQSQPQNQQLMSIVQQQPLQMQPQPPPVHFLPSYQEMTYVPQQQQQPQQTLFQQQPVVTLVQQQQPQYQVVQQAPQQPTYLLQSPPQQVQPPTIMPIFSTMPQHEPISVGRGPSMFSDALSPFFTWDRPPGSSNYFPTGLNSDVASTLLRAPGDAVVENMRRERLAGWLARREVERLNTEVEGLKTQQKCLKTYIESAGSPRFPCLNETLLRVGLEGPFRPSFSSYTAPLTNHISTIHRREDLEGRSRWDSQRPNGERMRDLGRPLPLKASTGHLFPERPPRRLDPAIVKTLAMPRCLRAPPRVICDPTRVSLLGDGDARPFPELNRSGVTLTKAKHYCIPSVANLDQMTEANGDCFVQDFKVGHVDYGEVTFPGRTNVKGLDLDHVVDFLRGWIIMYPGTKPPYGVGLYRKGIVQLKGVFPHDPNSKLKIRNAEQIREMRFEDDLKQHFLHREGVNFISYEPYTGTMEIEIQTE